MRCSFIVGLSNQLLAFISYGPTYLAQHLPRPYNKVDPLNPLSEDADSSAGDFRLAETAQMLIPWRAAVDISRRANLFPYDKDVDQTSTNKDDVRNWLEVFSKNAWKRLPDQ